ALLPAPFRPRPSSYTVLFCAPGLQTDCAVRCTRTSHAVSLCRDVVSKLPDRAQRPSGLHDTEVTVSVCPSKVRRHLPLDTSHSRSVLSALIERVKRPSGLHDTEVTWSVCPSKVRSH